MGDKEYLGDGVYVARRDADGAVVLTTENGVETTNIIYLDPTKDGTAIYHALRARLAETIR